MKKYWYTLLLAFSLLISAIISTLPASVYGIVTSVFVRVCSNGQEMIENIDAELSAVKHDHPETSQTENTHPVSSQTTSILRIVVALPQRLPPSGI